MQNKKLLTESNDSGRSFLLRNEQGSEFCEPASVEAFVPFAMVVAWGVPKGEARIRGLGELHAGDEGAGDGDFFGEGDFRSFYGEVLETVAGAALEDEVAEVYELVFVLGVAASGHEVGEDDDVIGEVVVTVAVFPDFELDVDVASEVAEGCADAVPVADGIIVVGSVALGNIDAEVIKQVFDAVSDDGRVGFVGVGCCHFFEFWG